MDSRTGLAAAAAGLPGRAAGRAAPWRRRTGLAAAAAAGLLAAACGAPPPPDGPAIRPVRTLTVQPSGGQRVRTFSGVARAGVESSLSFRVSGAIARLSVAVGDRVAAGTPIAALDPVDYELQVREAEAALRQAEAHAGNAAADLRRARSLYENDNAARTDLDAAIAAADSAAAQVESMDKRLELAARQEDYTRLSAPAAGAIADVLAEVNENVTPGQPVVVLTSGGAPDVELAVPEGLIRQVREGSPVSVVFDAIPGARFDGVVTEVGVTTTRTGTTFPVTVRLGPDAADIRPGMAAEVEIAFGVEGPDRFVVPAQAVGEDRVGRFVFVAEPSAAAGGAAGGDGGEAVARRRAVTVGAFAPGGLEITSGLAAGDRVVTAGVSHLQDGDRVRVAADGAGPDAGGEVAG